MSLPPLANVFAVYDEDPQSREALRRRLQASGEFAEGWIPAPGWVAAAAPLSGGAPDGEAVRRHGLAFAEGRDLLLDGADPEARPAEIASLADNAPEKLATLPGDFGFIRFRDQGGATVVRSCSGLAPFYSGFDRHLVRLREFRPDGVDVDAGLEPFGVKHGRSAPRGAMGVLITRCISSAKASRWAGVGL